MRAMVLLTLILLLSTPAFAAGFGIYGTGGGGKVDMMRIKSDGDYRVIYSMKNFFYGGGLFLESGGDDSTFHNRLAFGAEGMSTFGGECEYSRLMKVSLNNVFTFRVAGNEKYRLWIGPLIGLNFLTGLHSTTRNEVWSDKKKNILRCLALASSSSTVATYGLYYLHYETVWHRRLGFFIPVGLALGVNVRLSDSVQIALEGGFRCGALYLGKGGFNYEGYGNVGFIFGAM